MLDRPLLALLNRVLRQESWARQRLRPFAGRSVRISAPPLLSLTLVVSQDGTFHGASVEVPDVSIALPEHAPLRHFGRPQEALAAARLEGAADFAEALGFVFRNLRWDAEEELANVLGDIPARRLAGLARGVAGWPREVLGRISANVGEYLGREQPALPPQAAARQLADDISQAAQQVKDLEQRLSRLENRV